MIYGLIGEKLGHSYSKGIHEQLADYTYNLIELSREQLDVFMKEKKFAALNVTIPYKQTVIPYLDKLDDKAKKVGAVNTIVNRDGKLTGYNTDYYGFAYMLDYYGITISDRKVVVLGNGGASQAIQAVLKDKQAKEIVVVDPYSEQAISYDECYQKHLDAQVIVNTSPVGMYPKNEGIPVDLSKFSALESVADIVYNPLKTKLIVEAEKLQLKTTCGLMMLVAQAKQAVEIFTGKTLDDACIAQITYALMKEKQNIVLIGMPSCGKTTIAKELAKQLPYTIVDIDEMVEKQQGCTIAEIFAKHGETVFRDLETSCVKEYAKGSCLILSTGGGVIKKAENMDALKQNGIIVYIQRDLDLLVSDATRPLSKSKEAIAELYKERKALYEMYSDIVVENNQTVMDAVLQIVDRIGGKHYDYFIEEEYTFDRGK